MTYTDLASGSLTLGGSSSVWYTDNTNPTVTVNGNLFNGKRPTSYFICPINITPNFISLSNTNTILHLPKPITESLISGYKVYTLYCQKVIPTNQTRILDNTRSHIFISVTPYK